MAIKKINELMENKKKEFNPLFNFSLNKILSQEAPQFYTEQELAQIDEISESFGLGSTCTMKGEKVNNKERCCSIDESSMSHHEERIAKSKPKEKREPKKQDKETVPSSPPKLPTRVENKIKELNGRDIKYIMCKKLYSSDLDEDKNRLSMPIKKENLDFLLDIEKETLEDQKDKPGGDLKVIMLDPCFRNFTMSLRKWYMGTSSVYNLVQNWKHVLSENKFEIAQLLNIWSFRDVHNKLCFVLVDDKKSVIEGCEKLENPVDLSNMKKTIKIKAQRVRN
ncbi:B3 domain-containing protein At2g31420-like [Trifolium pratense]|uniref:B3 domain-containing protein At2g31420-like n=1 Tax=Trifolium pratense TaxID=57577 RepID=UPI001E692006|nr:B3 domain-containing protein At2g31420-like [Trifolium pratense]